MENRAPKSILARALDPYKGLGSSLWSMFFATMINRFGDFVGPFLALYLTRALGYDAARSGAFVALAFGAAALGAFASGRAADSLGRKGALLACQSAGAALTFAMSFFFRETWAPWLIVGASLFRGAARPLIGAVLTDLSPPERRKEVFGLQYWSINVGVAVGPLVAAFLFDANMPWLFRGDAAATLASVVTIARGVRMPAGGAAAATVLERHDERGAARAFLSRPILLAFCAIALVSTVTYSQTGFALPLRLSSALGADGTSFFGIMMSLNAMTVIVLSLPVARVLRGLSPMVCMALSGAFYVLGFGLLAAPVGKMGFAASTFVWTVGEIVAATNTGVFIAKHSPANWRASFQSFIGVFFQAGWSLGPLAAGPFIEAAGHSALWLSTAAVCALWAAAALALDRADRRIGAAAADGGALER